MEKSNARFLSLDVFRGMTICLMIIVNSPGGGATPFAPLLHAHWHGFTPTDLVFPSFLFAVGNAMSFSLRKYVALGNAAVLTKIFKRTALIFLLGYLMYWFPFFQIDGAGHITGSPISETRIFGVLQRIALCYGLAALLIYYFPRKIVAATSIFLLLGYWVVLLVFGLPGDQLSLTGNAVLRLDKFLLGDSHLYHGEGIAFDPEGFLSTFPAIVNVVIGYYAGKFIQTKGKGYETVAKLMLAGAVLIFAALCWNMTFPINKKLWTSSFVLVTTGLDLMIMSALVYVLEMKNWDKGSWSRFFVIFGKNPLFIYLLSELVLVILFMIPVTADHSLFDWISVAVFQHIAPGAVGSFLFAVCYMLFCWSIGWFLDKQKIYIRV